MIDSKLKIKEIILLLHSTLSSTKVLLLLGNLVLKISLDNDGIISFHDKLVVRLEKDAIPKISIQGDYFFEKLTQFLLEMANLSEFFIEYKDMLEDALTKGRLKEILELWLEFIEKCAMKLESKLSAFDDLFG